MDKVASEMTPLKIRQERNTTTGYASYGEDGHVTAKCMKQHIIVTTNPRATPYKNAHDQLKYFFDCTLLTANSEYFP